MVLTGATAIWSLSNSPTSHPSVGVTPHQPTVVTLASPTTSAPPTTPPVVVDPQSPTTIIDPNTYRPSYETIPSLVDDAAFVFIGTARPLYQDSDLGTATPFAVDQILAGREPDTLPIPAIPEGAHGDIPVVVGQEYIVFLGVDLTGQADTECVVGGIRGLFHYSSATRTVTRISTGPSHIPEALSLTQFMALIPSPNVLVPIKEPTPSVCSPSVTGG